MNLSKTACLLLVAGLSAGGCGAVNKVDQALTMYEPSHDSPYRGSRSAAATRCHEWNEVMSNRELDEERWRFGCVNAASLVVSVSDKRDLERGRRLRPSEGWEAKDVQVQYRQGKFDPGVVDTSKSSTTSTSQ